MPTPMRFKDAFPFRVTRNAASPGLTRLRHLCARYWYPSSLTARLQFRFEDLDGNVYNESNAPGYSAPQNLLLLTLTRKQPYSRNDDMGGETLLAQQTVQAACPGVLYKGSMSWANGASVGTGSLGGTYGGAFALEVFLEDFAEGQFNPDGHRILPGGGNEYLESFDAGPALTWYDDLTGRVPFVLTARMTITPFAADVVFPAFFASFQFDVSSGEYLVGADEGGSKVVFRPPGTRIDETFAIYRTIHDPDALLPAGLVPSLTLGIVEMGRLPYDGTAPALPDWDWGDL